MAHVDNRLAQSVIGGIAASSTLAASAPRVPEATTPAGRRESTSWPAGRRPGPG